MLDQPNPEVTAAIAILLRLGCPLSIAATELAGLEADELAAWLDAGRAGIAPFEVFDQLVATAQAEALQQMPTDYQPPEVSDIIYRLPRREEMIKHRGLHKVKALVVAMDGEKAVGHYDPVERYRAQARQQLAAGDFGLVAHYRISSEGRLWRTQPESVIVKANSDASQQTLVVCLDLGTGQHPTPAQLATLGAYLEWMTQHRSDIPAGRADVVAHGVLAAFVRAYSRVSTARFQ